MEVLVTEGKGNIINSQKNNVATGELVPGWMSKADLDLISLSAVQLLSLTDSCSWDRVALPRPGCGAGGLEWDRVRPLLANILDDRFTIVDINS